MNEPRKLAVVFLIVMAIGLVALAVEWLWARVSGLPVGVRCFMPGAMT